MHFPLPYLPPAYLFFQNKGFDLQDYHYVAPIAPLPTVFKIQQLSITGSNFYSDIHQTEQTFFS